VEPSHARPSDVKVKNRGGRPRCRPTVPAQARLPVDVYDRLAVAAHRNGTSLAAELRRLIILQLS
jgi:hypothetical protein